MSVIWSLAGFVIAFPVTRNAKISLFIGALIFSHWALDFIAHPMGFGKDIPPDQPLFFDNSPRVGLGLYKSITGGLISEFGLLIIGSIFYLKKTKANDHAGKFALPVLILFVFITLVPAVFLPFNLIYLSPALYLFLIPIGIWTDRHRSIINSFK